MRAQPGTVPVYIAGLILAASLGLDGWWLLAVSCLVLVHIFVGATEDDLVSIARRAIAKRRLAGRRRKFLLEQPKKEASATD